MYGHWTSLCSTSFNPRKEVRAITTVQKTQKMDMKGFFKGNQYCLYVRLWYMNSLVSFLLRKSNTKLCSVLENICKYSINSLRDPLQRTCCRIQKTVCYCKTCPGTRRWSWKLFCKPHMTCTYGMGIFPPSNERWSLEKVNQWQRHKAGKKFRNSDAAFRTKFRIR